MKHALVSAALAAALASPAVARPGDAVPEVTQFIQKEISRLATVAEPEIGPVAGRRTYSGYELSLFRLRLKAEVGFDVGVAKITVEPYAEFFWE